MDNPIEIEIISANAGSIHLSPTLPSLYEPETITGIRRMEARGPFGHILLQEIAGNGYAIWHHNYFLHKSDTLTFTWNKPALRLWLSLKNSFYYSTAESPEQALHERGFNIDYSPILQQTIRLHDKQIYSCVEFHFSADLFSQWTPYFEGVEKFLHRAKMQQSLRLNQHNAIASMELLALVDDILYCTYSAAIRRKYLAHKVMEILFLSLEQITRVSPQTPDRLSETVVTRIYEARQLMTENPARKYSLYELSAIVGLSIHNLKKGFKTIFNLSVKDFLHETRMQKARLLLEETDLSINCIAADMGYTHPFAFSSAFKKFFGYPPSLIRKSRRIHKD
jgi:AraC-like DNA-binding protein